MTYILLSFKFLTILFLLLWQSHSSNVHIIIFLTVYPYPCVLLEKDSIEVPSLGEVVLVAAPAGRPLQVDHDLLQLPLYHADARPDGQQNNQTEMRRYIYDILQLPQNKYTKFLFISFSGTKRTIKALLNFESFVFAPLWKS